MKHRLRTSLILVLCLIKFAIRGSAKKKFHQPKKIAVLQLAKLGDMVCTTPVFRAIKGKYSSCAIIVVGNRINRDVLQGNTDIDDYVIWENDSISMAKKLKEKGIDSGVVTSPSFEGLASLYLSGADPIISPKIKNGNSPYETRPYRILQNFVVSKPHAMGSYAPREYLRLLEPFGIVSDDTKKHLAFSEKAFKAVEELLKAEGVEEDSFLVVISPSAGNKIKKWDSKKFALLADRIYKNYKSAICLIGVENDKQEVGEMIRSISPETKVVNLCTRLDIDELKALISHARMLIAVDTGPIYIAEAFNIPTIDIIGPIDENEQPPRGQIHKRVIAPTREKPLMFVMNARMYDPVIAKRASEDITVDMVWATFEELYKEIL